LLKVDQDGNFIDTTWYNGTGSVLGRNMQIRQDGSVAVAASAGSNNGLVIFFDSSFNASWSQNIDSTVAQAMRANAVDFFPNGDIALGGFSNSSSESKGLLQRYSDTGSLIWSLPVDSVGTYNEVRSIHVNSTGNIAFTGASGGAAIVGVADGTAGSIIWRRVYNPTSSSDSGVKVRFTPAGNIAFISRGSTGFVSRYYTVQYTGSGSFDWAMIYSQTASDREPVDILIEPNNRVVTAGWAINGNNTNYDYVLAGYSPTGAVEFINTYTTPGINQFNWDLLRDLERDNMGNFIVTGQTSAEYYTSFRYRMLTIKYGTVLTSVAENNLNPTSSAFVYPNPSGTGKLMLMDASPVTITTGKIYDLQGRFISEMDKFTGEINMQQCSPGIYFLVIERADFSKEQIRFVVN
jgi:hypothetical protein